MNILKIVLVTMFIVGVGCGDNEQVMDRDHACLEQAYAWCNYVNSGSGCWYIYMYSCSLPRNPTDTIRQSLENNCLDEMIEAAKSASDCVPKSYCMPGPVPAACRRLWADQGGLTDRP